MDSFNDLLAKNKELDEKQNQLIEEIKTKHTQAYNWLVENNIDLTDIKKYSKNIALALVITTGTATAGFDDTQEKQELVSSIVAEGTGDIEVITQEELSGLTEDERAQLVWYRYGPIIEKTAKKYDLDPGLIFATIMLESKGDSRAYRYEPHIGDASYGLGQILYGTARGIGFEGTPEDLYDPETNIDLIGQYHSRNQEVYGGNLTPEELTIVYNTGNPNGTPHPGHMQKFSKWFNKAKQLMV